MDPLFFTVSFFAEEATFKGFDFFADKEGAFFSLLAVVFVAGCFKAETLAGGFNFLITGVVATLVDCSFF